SVAIPVVPSVKRLFPNSKLIFNTVDLHFLRYEREQQLLKQFPDYRMPARSLKINRQDEVFLVDQCDATIVVSDQEKELLDKLAPEANIAVIPLFGEVVGRNKNFEERFNIGFIGGYQHPPNADAVKHFVKDIWPKIRTELPQCKFVIAGSNVTPEIEALANSKHGIEVKGFVPEVGAFLEEIRVMVAPLRYGAGIKGKIVSALCHGVPQVISEQAGEGMGLEHGNGVFIAPSDQEFCECVVSLYKNESVWNLASDGAENVAHELYSKSRQAVKISNLLRSMNLS
ncbi:MAG: glycosyltransferase family 4 protein, partial [Pseudomonadota bacterium]